MKPRFATRTAEGASPFHRVTQMDAAIRPARPGDLERLAELWIAFLEEQADLDDRVQVAEDALERWRNDYPAWIHRDQRHILVAERGGELSGFAAAIRHEPAPIFAYVPEVFVEELYVRPDARRKGLGAALFGSMREWGESWGARRIRLSVLASNEEARAFWSSLGLTDMSITMALAVSGPGDVAVREKNRIGFGA